MSFVARRQVNRSEVVLGSRFETLETDLKPSLPWFLVIWFGIAQSQECGYVIGGD
jgi:hypothetical protein